jgi:thioredoxin-related protein
MNKKLIIGIISILLICLVSVLVLNITNNYDNGVKWKNYNEGISELKTVDKPLFLYFTEQGCKHCQDFKNAASTNETLINKINEYIPVMVELEKDPELCKKYNITGYPTFIILDSDEKEVNRITGFSDIPEFINGLK